MTRSVKSVLLLALLLIAALALTACGGDNGQQSSEPQQDFIYQAEYVDLPADIESMNYSTFAGDTLYFTSHKVIGQREPQEGEPLPGDEYYYEGYYDIWGPVLAKVNIDGTGYTELSNYQAPKLPAAEGGTEDMSYETEANISGLTVDASGNIWVAEQAYMHHIDEQDNWVDDGTMNYLRKLDDTGAEISSMDISFMSEGEEYFSINNILADNAGNVYIASNNKVWVFNIETEQHFYVEVPDWINSIQRLADGTVAATAYETNGMTLKPIDVTAKAWGKNIPLSDNIWEIFSGGGDYDFYYQDGSNFYGYDIETQTETKLINWIDSDIDNDLLSNYMPMEDGRIVCTVEDYRRFRYSRFVDDGKGMEMQGSLQLVILSKQPSADIQEKTILNLATLWMGSDLKTAVIEFNKTNPDYRIRVTNYSDFDTENDYNAGLTKLNTDIISGNVPDIINTGSLPIRQYAAKGLLEDLYPLIAADSELNGKLMEDVLRAASIDGKLYEAFADFYIYTAVGASSVVGPEPGWTMDEMNAVLAQHPGATAFSNIARSDIFYYMMMFNMNDYVDWQTGECHFESDNFIKMLEFAATFPEAIDWESEGYVDEYTAVMEGMALLVPAGISDFESYQMYKAMFGGDITYIGFPSENGCGSVFSITGGLAISANSPHKEGAWSFVRNIFTKEYGMYNSWSLPVNKELFDMLLAKAMEKDMYIDEEGNEVERSKGGWGWGENLMVEIYAATQEDVDQIMDLMSRIDSTMSFDESMMGIIQEETGAFFAGQKSARETASLIQNRISIYVNEQR